MGFAKCLIALLALNMLQAASATASDIKVGFTQDALTLDPANHRKRETETIIRNICDGLLTRDSGMRLLPEMAASYQQIDPLTWEFKIRDGIVSHAGEKVQAEDIKASFDRILQNEGVGGQTSPRQSLLGPMKAVEVTDPLTVRFKLSSPWPILPAMLPFQEAVTKGFAEKARANSAASLDCGGPFRLVEWRRGESVIMERDPGYYGGSPQIPVAGPAKADRIVFRIIPENSSRVAALLAGEVDIINELPVSAVRQVEGSGNAKVMATNGTRTFFVALNVNKKPFNDVRVRKALNYALNKKLIVDRVLGGRATLLNGVMSPEAFAFSASLPEYQYDSAKAKSLLAEAGYADGFEATLDVEGAFKDTAEVIASFLQKIGVKAKVQVWEGAVLTPLWRNAEQRKDRDMYLNSWGNAALDPSDIMVPTLKTANRGNTSGYSNAKVDDLLTQAETESDPEKRKARYLEAQAIVNDEAPWIFLWVPQDLYGVSKKLKGWTPSPDSKINLHRAYLE
jgi:peptide/nickel transport system substrate-binding protein